MDDAKLIEAMALKMRACAFGQRKNASIDVVIVNPEEAARAALSAISEAGYVVAASEQ